jgi:glycosyltransferase involved in cell wall biosynthesis
MNILGLSKINSGCGYHRIVCPLGYMNDIKAMVTNIPTPEILKDNYDIIFYNRFSAIDDQLEEYKKKYKIVLDLDDDWHLPATHLNYYDYIFLKDRLENNIKNADLVLCTNEKILNRVFPLNSNAQIIVNGLPYGVDQFTTEKVEDEKVRIFWCGSITHEHDISILRNPFNKLSQYRNKIKMIMGGYDDSNEPSKIIWDKMLSAFTNGKQLDYAVIRALLPNKYMEMYKHADIMVIPLENSQWHAAKSNLKILEAACKKIPVIVSAVEPYTNDSDAPLFFVHKQTDWIKHLSFLINNENARRDYGESLYEWALKKYNLKNINEIRRSAFANIIKA